MSSCQLLHSVYSLTCPPTPGTCDNPPRRRCKHVRFNYTPTPEDRWDCSVLCSARWRCNIVLGLHKLECHERIGSITISAASYLQRRELFQERRRRNMMDRKQQTLIILSQSCKLHHHSGFYCRTLRGQCCKIHKMCLKLGLNNPD